MSLSIALAKAQIVLFFILEDILIPPVEEIVIGLVVFFANLIYAFSKKKAAAQNPWGEGATTLEWTVPSPPNFHTFEELPKFEDEEGVEKSTG